jgi:hypothetical protein
LEVRVVDLLDQTSPGGAAVLGRHGELRRGLLWRADAQGWLGLMVAPPSLGSEADEVGLAGPCTASPRGVQTIRANQSAAGIREALEDFDEKPDGGETLVSVLKKSLYGAR